MKFSSEDLEKLKRAREQNPEFAKELDEIRKVFPGTKITYLKVGDIEFGTKSPDTGVVPCLGLSEYQPVLSKELSVYEKARMQIEIFKKKKRK